MIKLYNKNNCGLGPDKTNSFICLAVEVDL